MAMGLPVISTNWSGLTAFISDAVAYPIRVEGVVDVDDTGPNSFEWFQGQRWVGMCGEDGDSSGCSQGCCKVQ
jgi:hypothetical protein